MYRRALGQLVKFDVVGGSSQLNRWMQARAFPCNGQWQAPLSIIADAVLLPRSWSALSPALRLARHSSASIRRSVGG